MAKKRAEPKSVEIPQEEINAALRWPSYPKPERIGAVEINERTAHLSYAKDSTVRLWTYNAYSERVTLGCVSRSFHSSEGAVTTTQTQGGPWFETELEAYRALRWAVTEQVASKLYALDKRVPSPSPGA